MSENDWARLLAGRFTIESGSEMALIGKLLAKLAWRRFVSPNESCGEFNN